MTIKEASAVLENLADSNIELIIEASIVIRKAGIEAEMKATKSRKDYSECIKAWCTSEGIAFNVPRGSLEARAIVKDHIKPVFCECLAGKAVKEYSDKEKSIDAFFKKSVALIFQDAVKPIADENDLLKFHELIKSHPDAMEVIERLKKSNIEADDLTAKASEVWNLKNPPATIED
jgi:hypothetical protein